MIKPLQPYQAGSLVLNQWQFLKTSVLISHSNFTLRMYVIRLLTVAAHFAYIHLWPLTYIDCGPLPYVYCLCALTLRILTVAPTLAYVDTVAPYIENPNYDPLQCVC